MERYVKKEINSEILITTYYDIPLHCPFCGNPNIQYNSDMGGEIVGCDHLMLINGSEGIIKAHPRLCEEVRKSGYELVYEDDLFYRITKPDSDEDEDFEFDDGNILSIAQSFADSVTFCQIIGPPSGETTYTVFAYSDEEYEKFGDSI